MNRVTVVRNAVLTAIAWVSLLLYILACRPSWSPDGSKILFVYRDPDFDRAGVALVERATGESSVFFESDRDLVTAQWTEDGASAIFALDEDELLIHPVDPAKGARHVTLPDGLEISFLPIPLIGGHAYFGDGALGRLHLESGDIETWDFEGDSVILFEAGESVAYWRKSGDTRFEIGRVALESMRLEPHFSIEKAELSFHGLEEITFMAFDPSGTRIAITAVGDGDDRILLCGPRGLQSVVTPKIAAAAFELGDLDWSPDGATLYAGALTPLADGERTLLSIAEITLVSGETRVISISPIEDAFRSGDSHEMAAQIALSPEGTVLAVSTAAFDDDDVTPENRALYLMDLQDPARSVTRVPPPRNR